MERSFLLQRRQRARSSSFLLVSLWSIQMVASWLTPPIWTRGYNTRSSSRRLCTRTTDELPMIDLSPYKKDFLHITPLQWKLLEALSLKLYNWNAKVNLISRKDIDSLVPNHVVPCLGISQVRMFQKGETIIDVGSGGGLPGLPTAIVCPDAQFTLLDSNNKKMMVVQDIVTSLGLKNVRVICDRAENVKESYDFMLGRSVSAVPTFLGFSSHFINPNSLVATSTVATTTSNNNNNTIQIGSGLLYIKGGDFTDELQGAGIKNHHLFPITELIPSVVSEKYVLYIPSKDIVDFHHRYEKEKQIATGKKTSEKVEKRVYKKR